MEHFALASSAFGYQLLGWLLANATFVISLCMSLIHICITTGYKCNFQGSSARELCYVYREYPIRLFSFRTAYQLIWM